MKILIDMNLSPLWIPVLAEADIEAIHWSTVGDPRASDRTIFDWAATNGFVIFTHDLDFGTLLASSQAQSPSVIQIRSQDHLPDAVGDVCIAALQQFRDELESGALITIDETRTRARILPIR
jgi:predicted nuclease of predicted toxin-antitoxin system